MNPGGYSPPVVNNGNLRFRGYRPQPGASRPAGERWCILGGVYRRLTASLVWSIPGKDERKSVIFGSSQQTAPEGGTRPHPGAVLLSCNGAAFSRSV